MNPSIHVAHHESRGMAGRAVSVLLVGLTGLPAATSGQAEPSEAGPRPATADQEMERVTLEEAVARALQPRCGYLLARAELGAILGREL